MGEVETTPFAVAAGEHRPETEAKKRPSLATITGVLALAGALWYGLQSLVAAWVYAPIGVHPRDIGLGSAALLSQATIGLIALLLSLLIIMLIVALIWAVRSAEKKYKGATDSFAAFDAVLEVGITLFVWAVVWVFIAPLVLFLLADHARESIQDGKRPSTFGFPTAWPAEVAFPQSIAPDGPTLPFCVLYLGQAEGTAVLYDAAQKRTLRIPASSIGLNIEHDLKSCPAG
jgi:hypothetical protein